MGNIIEFYGPPGTGKSVLTEASIDYLGDNNLKVTNREEAHYLGFKRWLFEKRNTTEYRLLQFILKIIPLKIEKSLIKKSPIFIDKSKYESELLNQFLIENPRLFCHISSAINNRCQDVNRKRWPKPIFKRLFVYQNMKEDIQDYTVVVDEGFCHRVILNSYSLIWGCNLPSDYREKIKKIARHIAKNIDYSFFISADPKICLKRHEKSGRSKEVYKKLEDSFV